MFLTIKIHLPSQLPGTLTRERLYSALDECWAGQARLLLLSAPPGYGKTTLLSGWTNDREIPCAWVSLDAHDNDPGRFFLLLLHALEPHIPGLQDLLPVLSLPQVTSYESVAAEIVNRAVQANHTFLLALDDYHAITSQTIHSLMQMMLDHLPPQMRVAVLTREDPPFTLARFRARRQMLELRARELAFSDQEAQDLLCDVSSLSLDTGQVQALIERTEGWAAGLQLAALALRGHEQPGQVIDSFGGPHQFVLDYLLGEVLDKLPGDLRAFLCRSAVLDRFNASLCDAALGIEASQALIARARSANLFLVPLDDQGNWYRYHHLMAEILRSEIDPAERQAIHQRAMAWFQANKMPHEAIHYALEAHAYDIASAMIQAEAIPAAENGMLTTALGWLDALPPEILLSNPDLCVFRAWFLIFNGRFREGAAWLGQVTAQFTDLSGPLAGLLAGMRAWMASLTAQKLDVILLKEAYAMTGGRYPYFAPMMLLAIGQAQREQYDFPGALASFEEGANLAETSSGAVSALIIHNNQAFLHNEIGSSQAAGALCTSLIEQHSAPDGKPGLLAGIPLIVHGCLLAQAGQLEAAQSALTQSINLVRRLGLYDILTAPANHMLQFVLADQGRLDEALALNKEVRRRAVKAGLQVVVNESDVTAAWLHLISGSPSAAVIWSKTHPLPDTSDLRFASHILLHARVLALTSHQNAADLIEPVIEKCRAVGMIHQWIKACVELAVIWQAAGEPDKAQAALTQVIQYPEAPGYRQVFCRYAALLAPVFEALRETHPDVIDALGLPCGPLAAQASDISVAVHSGSSGLVEALTDRESEILRLVAAGLSNAEISERLFLTTGTVKWYLNQIFGKLGVKRRTEAVARAQAVGLF